jgi:hypothetical protein
MSSMFVLERKVLTVRWRQLHNANVCNFYSSPHFIGTIKSRRIKLVELEACEKLTEIWFESPKRSDHWQDIDIDRRIILKCRLQKCSLSV